MRLHEETAEQDIPVIIFIVLRKISGNERSLAYRGRAMSVTPRIFLSLEEDPFSFLLCS